ncbi:MAG: ABC transporter permease [Thermoanaerobaculia bacterium]
MSARDLLLFSAGALRGHRLRTSLSLLGVSIGVASVVLLTSLGEGARRYVTREFAALGSNLLIVTQGKTETTGIAGLISGAPHDLTLADVDALARRVRAVRRAAPLSFGSAPARWEERRRDADVVGSTAEFAPVRRLQIRSGRYLPPGDAERGARVCVVGPKIARELFREENPLGKMLRVGDDRFRVIGVLAPRGASLGIDLDDTVHVPVSRAMKMFNQTSLFRILVEVRSHEEIPGAKAAATSVLRERHDGEEDFTILTQDSVLSTFGDILDLLTAALAGIAGISLTVAGVGIMNVMLVSVSERTREIGLLKAVGVSARQIVAVFLVEAAILSTAGGAVGLGGAWAVTRAATALSPAFPIEPPLWAVVTAAAVSLSVGLAFGAFPARRAARLDPVAALAKR